MTTNTTNLDLVLYNNTTDAGDTFLNYRTAMNGVSTSNMLKIDAAFDNIINNGTLHNTGLGIGVFASNTTGTRLIAIGEDALGVNTTGNDNINIGYGIGSGSTATVSDNIIIGNASFTNGTGSRNLIIGNSAGSTVGSGNILLGYHAAKSFFSSDSHVFALANYDGELLVEGNLKGTRSGMIFYSLDSLGVPVEIRGYDNPFANQSSPLQRWISYNLHSATTKLEVGWNGDLIFYSNASIQASTTSGTNIGTATTQKIGFWGVTPIVQPANANQTALTNSTGGSYDTVLEDVGGSFSQSKLNNNFTDVYTLLNEIRTALVAAGIMKGAA